MPALVELAQILGHGLNKQRSEAALVSLDEKTDQPLDPVLKFQYFPSTIQDTYQAQYVSQQIMGGSLPIEQWVSGGPRTISFEAMFTCDTDLLAKSKSDGIALQSRLEALGQLHRNIDIRSAIAWLRSFVFPRYSSGEAGPTAALTYAPRKAMLIMPNSGIGAAGGQVDSAGNTQADSVICHMTQCEVNYQMFHPSGLPKIVKVNLSFNQIPQLGGNVKFPSATSLDTVVDPAKDSSFLGEVVSPYFGYPLKVTGTNRTASEEGPNDVSGSIARNRPSVVNFLNKKFK